MRHATLQQAIRRLNNSPFIWNFGVSHADHLQTASCARHNYPSPWEKCPITPTCNSPLQRNFTRYRSSQCGRIFASNSMPTIRRALRMFVAILFKSRWRPEGTNLCHRHNIADERFVLTKSRSIWCLVRDASKVPHSRDLPIRTSGFDQEAGSRLNRPSQNARPSK